ncbi:MAG: hypothetical protein DRJ06_08305 [Candidatus Aminicenantes bacterium]|nr:MAG: hypothetical protein DRJ06_08305 [Candidatus Aminicenantes bacterium]
MEEILGTKEIEREIIAAKIAKRMANFANKVIQEINISETEIDTPISFEGAKILGRVYFSKTTFNEDVIFRSAIVNHTFYLGESTIRGNLECQKIKVREGMNLVGARIEKNANLEEAVIKGFLGMNRTEIIGETNLKRIAVLNLEDPVGIIEGDVYLQKANVRDINMEGAIIEGSLDMQGITIFGSLNMTNTKINDILLLKGGIIRGGLKIEGLKYKERIA